MNYLGIDPGGKGGAAVLSWNGKIIEVFGFEPLTDRDIYDRLLGLPSSDITAIIEDVHSMPEQGVVSTFKFGNQFGMLRGFLIALQIPHKLVSPQKWKARMGCLCKGKPKKTKTEKKNIDKAEAQRRYPKIKMTHAIADALLIATYCRETTLTR